MVDISPQGQFLMALNNAFQSARANAPQGNLGAGIPGVQGGGTENGPGSPGGGAPAAVSIGGGVPGTALTGTGIANALVGGGAPAGLAGSAEGQSVISSLMGRNPNTFGEDLGADPTGGSGKMLAAFLSGNPILIAAALAGGISGQGSGPFPSDKFPGTGILSDSGNVFTPSVSSPLGPGTPNTIHQGTGTGGGTFEQPTGPTISNIRVGPVPSLNALNRDRPETQSGSGASPSRGTVSNAGR